MTEHKHTPGPWKIDPCGDILGNRNTDTDNGLICAMCEDRRDGEGIANAHLIAAAPDLLAALEFMVFDCEENMRRRGHFEQFITQHTCAARTAIAKARGQS